MPEAKIKIGRYHLNSAQSMTVRVALASFVFEPDADDEQDAALAALYKRRVTEIFEMIQITTAEKKYAKP